MSYRNDEPERCVCCGAVEHAIETGEHVEL
jgi:hypothetical protein